jgi:hypothetical protein
MKFKVGQVWADRKGKQYDVIRTNLPMPYPTQIRDTHGNSSTRTASGNYYTSGIDMLDLITLIKDTEETMETKFKVGDRVSRSVGCDVLGVIEHIRDGREYPYVVKCTDGSRGVYMGSELVPVKEETVSEVRTSMNDKPDVLPPEPIPGQYYRTRHGLKLEFLGKLSRWYFYESADYDYHPVNVYDTHPYEAQEHDGGPNDHRSWDIIAPWTEPPVGKVLPSLEIKRWAVVQVMDKRVEYGYAGGHTDEGFDDIKRGTVLKINSDINYLKRNLKDGEEIVELTGTLPAREGV